MLRHGIAALLLTLTMTAAAGPASPTHAAPAPAQARSVDEVATLSEMSNLATAEEQCAIDTSWYVALEALNDTGVLLPTRPYDYISNGGGCYAIKPAEGVFRSTRVNLLTAYLKWDGPYITFQAGRTQTAAAPYDQGSPLDLWGTPYYFFTPYGLVRGDSGTITQELYGDAFDRPTIVSLGPDGVMSSDDLAWQFGAGVSGLKLTSLRGPGVAATYAPGKNSWSAPAGVPLSLRGHNLGTAPADGKAFFGGTELPWTSWTDQAIQIVIPSRLVGKTDTLTVKKGSATSSALTVNVTASRNAAHAWALYE